MWRLCLTLVVIAGCTTSPSDEPSGTATGMRYLGGSANPEFARALEPREFVFPADHGAHPEYQTEWWYFTGNLADGSGRHFGFELTFFRYAMAPRSPAPSPNAWRSNQAWMAHFAVTDTNGGQFHAAERRSRQALALAGAATGPLRVWVEDWSLEDEGGAGTLALTLHAADSNIGLALELSSRRQPIAHGDRGLSRKGRAPGNASYYYSVPRLAARGTVTVAGENFIVSGLAWMDREWSTSSLDPDVVGWDWFALDLTDGNSIMFYRLRTAAGSSSTFSGGSLIGDAHTTHLSADDVTLAPLEYWTSSATGSRYPVAWRVTVPSANIDLRIRPYLERQEVNLSVRYWEGAVRGEGTGSTGPVGLQGYLELAGY